MPSLFFFFGGGISNFSLKSKSHLKSLHSLLHLFPNMFKNSFPFFFLINNQNVYKKRKMPPRTQEVYKRKHLARRRKKNKKIMKLSTKGDTKAFIQR
jgi:hypothetical protein